MRDVTMKEEATGLVQWTDDERRIYGYWSRPGEVWREDASNAIDLPAGTVFEHQASGGRYLRHVHMGRLCYSLVGGEPNKHAVPLRHGDVYRVVDPARPSTTKPSEA